MAEEQSNRQQSLFEFVKDAKGVFIIVATAVLITLLNVLGTRVLGDQSWALERGEVRTEIRSLQKEVNGLTTEMSDLKQAVKDQTKMQLNFFSSVLEKYKEGSGK